jgi:TPR repeat protein
MWRGVLFCSFLVMACSRSDGQTTAPRSRTAAACGATAECERRCAERGEGDACALVAERYLDGKNGHPLDLSASFRHATRACELGYAYGCSLLGLHYQDGRGTDWDPARAMAAYETGCKGGSGVGCYNLSTMYSGGHGVIADRARATAYKERARVAWNAACRGAEPRWCTNAAFLVVTEGPVDPGKQTAALALNQRACDHGVTVGCSEALRYRVELGQITPAAYMEGLEGLCRDGEPSACGEAAEALLLAKRGVGADAPRGLRLARRACEVGDRHSCQLLAAAHEAGRNVPRDAARSIAYADIACQRSGTLSCLMVAADHYRNGRLPQAAAYTRRACQGGEGEACAVMSQLTLAGEGVPRSEAEALRWTTESCRMGFPPGCLPLIQRGLDLPVPDEIAPRMYEHACQQGIQPACERAGAGK